MEEYTYPYEYVNETSNCKYAIYTVDNSPNEIAFNGSCFIFTKTDDLFCQYGYISEILINPTYLDLLLEAEKQIETTQDFNHIYFEGVQEIIKVNPNLYQIELILGS
jgi:hypothetical protein